MPFDIDVASCESRIGHHFKNPQLLINALTHSSIKTSDNPSNERLEFLGDAILGQEISLFLYKKYPNFNEGQLTKIKSVVVSRAVIGRVCREMQMQAYILIGKGILRSELPVSLYANIFEAIIAAIYLDGGIRATRKFVRTTLTPEIDAVIKNVHQKNFKSLLQHFAQKQLRHTPVYKTINEEGPDHNKTFEIQVQIGTHHYSLGLGRSKKEAEQNAAAATLLELQKLGFNNINCSDDLE
ncbi:ribonuclease III [Planctomycetota bacterium]